MEINGEVKMKTQTITVKIQTDGKWCEENCIGLHTTTWEYGWCHPFWGTVRLKLIKKKYLRCRKCLKEAK
jgi:hypothetical protein